MYENIIILFVAMIWLGMWAKLILSLLKDNLHWIQRIVLGSVFLLIAPLLYWIKDKIEIIEMG